MDVLALLTTRTAVAQLVGLLFAVLAYFHVALPATADQPAVVGAAMMVLAAVTAILRFHHGDGGVKEWWQSKTIWTQIVAATFSVLIVLNLAPAAVDQESVVAGIMGVLALLNILLRRIATATIA